MDMFIRRQWNTKVMEELVKEESFDLRRAVEKDSFGLTPLGWSTLYQRWDLTDELLEKKTDPNASCSEGITPLHIMFIKYNPNMFPLPSFRPSFYYMYTEGISPLCLVVEQERIPEEFIKQLAESGTRVLPDRWGVTGLTFARMAKLSNEIKLIQELFDLSVRDVIEAPLLQSVPNSMPSIPNKYLTVSLKHGLPLSETSLVHSWIAAKSFAVRHLAVLEKIQAFYPFPSMALKIYLNVPFTAFTHQYNTTNPVPEDDPVLFKVFIIYLQLIGTDYPSRFIESFTDDALKMANKEVRIIYLFLILLEKFLDARYKTDASIEWFELIDNLFEKNYAQLLKVNVRHTGYSSEKGDGLVNRLAMIISKVNIYCRYDSRLEAQSTKWVKALSQSDCRKKPFMTIIVLYSDGLYESENVCKLIQFLVANGADINERDRDSLTTCLHTVVERNNPVLFKFLLEMNAYLFTVDQNGNTALDLISLKYPDNKETYFENSKVNPPYALKSLAALKLAEFSKLESLFAGHHDSKIWKFMKLHYKYKY
eukprot:TRINITY_DN2599_c0_g3_i1.p1 TRINITY_DN2599_c0_g3~~TRINITY_DN2599_c0_g3_i1.p1  ORF type:complete len:537 (-),score=75.06 TRINITY_DN2599_c0_g3_i1:15-1625(-)